MCRGHESNDTIDEVPRDESVVNRGTSMSLLHAPPPDELSRYAVLVPTSNSTYASWRTNSDAPATSATDSGSRTTSRNINCPSTCYPLRVESPNKTRDIAGDITVIEASVGSFKFFLAGVYVHPGSPNYEIEYLIHSGLGRYGKSINKIIPKMEPDLTTPIVLMGDFNKEADKNPEMIKNIREEYGLSYFLISPTTLDNTAVDLTFARNVNPLLKYYVCRYSYHRPILHTFSAVTRETNK